jgi:hypothetical protein
VKNFPTMSAFLFVALTVLATAVPARSATTQLHCEIPSTYIDKSDPSGFGRDFTAKFDLKIDLSLDRVSMDGKTYSATVDDTWIRWSPPEAQYSLRRSTLELLWQVRFANGNSEGNQIGGSYCVRSQNQI